MLKAKDNELWSLDTDKLIQILLRSNIRLNSLRSKFKDEEQARTIKQKELPHLKDQLEFMKNESFNLNQYIKKISMEIETVTDNESTISL